MREVGAPHERVGTERLEARGADRVVHEREPDLAPDVVARLQGERDVHHGAELLGAVVHALHPVRQPPDVALGADDLQARELLEHATLHELAHRALDLVDQERVAHRGGGEVDPALVAHAGDDVQRQRELEVLRGRPQAGRSRASSTARRRGG